MNTFLPYPDFVKSAQCLDYRRLGKQRVEAWQIYLALTKKDYGWKNHPIVKMWKGSELALLLYGLYFCIEWKSRGYKDTMLEKFDTELWKKRDFIILPKWLGNRKFHSAMRSNLLRKDKKYYSKFDWKEKDNLPYHWIKNDNI
jgi:hypothetical protein